MTAEKNKPDNKKFNSVYKAVKRIFGESRNVVKKNYVAGGDINEASTRRSGSLCEPSIRQRGINDGL